MKRLKRTIIKSEAEKKEKEGKKQLKMINESVMLWLQVKRVKWLILKEKEEKMRAEITLKGGKEENLKSEYGERMRDMVLFRAWRRALIRNGKDG